MRAPNRLPAFILVDAHVHFHPCFEADAFLDGAVANFARGAAQVGVPGPFAGCLVLTEMGEAHWLRRLRVGEAGAGSASGAWSFAPTAEAESLVAHRASGERLVLIAGRQIASREAVEVLALGQEADVPDGLPLAETLSRVRDCGALPVLPWGFGKWWLNRGSLIAAAFAGRRGEELYLGDNAGRPTVGGSPELFRLARGQGVPVLPGSDPLPLPEHVSRAGSYGFVLSGPLDEAQPAAALLRGVRRLKGQPRIFGRRDDLPRFLRAQAALRWRRRSGADVTVPRVEGAMP